MNKLERDVTSNERSLVAVMAGASGGIAVHFPGVTCVQTPTPMLAFNSAYLESPLGIGEKSLAEVRAFYEGSPEWAVNLPGPMAGLLSDYQRRVRVSRCDTEWEVIMREEDAKPKRKPQGLEVETVESLGRLRVWARTSALGFEMPPESFSCFVSEEELRIPGMTYLLGTNGGRPVATSASYVSDGVAGVYFISTVRSARGRGYGEAVVDACVREGFSRGARIASLQCGNLGYPWYYRMGFRPLFQFQRWVASGKPRTG